ncbi:MAG: hypothetical protein AMXMBFR83_24370 [Phycisphaerae bacterium]
MLLPAVLIAASARAELRIPAHTAYLDPDPEGAEVSRTGITGWSAPATRVSWFGELKTAGRLECALAGRWPERGDVPLRLSVGGQSREAQARGGGEQSVTVRFAPFEISELGYHRFVLESLSPGVPPAGTIEALLIDGPAAQGAHFHFKPRRNAASVHLFYPLPKEEKVEAFYCEVTGLADPPATYYMACGWHRGYFGMQVINDRERRIIFSVWDSGGEARDRAKVAAEDRVTLLAKGPGVYAGDFGNEGTGGHSHLKYMWKTNQKQRFLVTAEPTDATHTVYTGYYFHPEKKEWFLISSWKAPREGGYLRGLYSFSENFNGSTGHMVRKALYGNQWIRTAAGRWLELTTATFSHDDTGKSDRLDRCMGLEQGAFFLAHGGFVPGFTRYGERFVRPSAGRPPVEVHRPLPPTR